MKNNNAEKINEAILLINNSSFSKAVKLLEEIIIKDNSDFRLLYLLGTAYLKLGKLDLAELNLTNCLKFNENLTSALHNLGITLSLKKNFSEAKKKFLKVLELEPKNLDTMIELARNYELSKNLNEAKKHYEEILKIDAKNKTVNNLLGRMLINMGFHKLGLNYLRKSIGLIRFKEQNFEIIK